MCWMPTRVQQVWCSKAAPPRADTYSAPRALIERPATRGPDRARAAAPPRLWLPPACAPAMPGGKPARQGKVASGGVGKPTKKATPARKFTFAKGEDPREEGIGRAELSRRLRKFLSPAAILQPDGSINQARPSGAHAAWKSLASRSGSVRVLARLSNLSRGACHSTRLALPMDGRHVCPCDLLTATRLTHGPSGCAAPDFCARPAPRASLTRRSTSARVMWFIRMGTT